MLMADASGHGVPAALITIMAKFHFSALASSCKDPSQLLFKVNDELTKALTTTHYLTAFYGIIQKNLTFIYANGSHENVILLRGSSLRELTGDGFMVGAVKNPPLPYRTQKTKLKPGDRLVFFTDGVTEAENIDGRAYGLSRFKTQIRKHVKQPLGSFKQKLVEDLDKHLEGARRFDDYTIMVVEIKANQQKVRRLETQAKRLVKKKDFAQAIETYRQLIAEEPDRIQYKFQMAICYFQSGEYEQAAPLFEESIEADVGSKAAYKQLATAYEKADKPIRAIKTLQRAVAVYPDAIDLHKNLFTLFYVKKDKHGAKKHYDVISKLDRRNKDLKKLQEQLKEL